MKIDDIRELMAAGEAVAVEMPQSEANLGSRFGATIAKATIVAAPHEFTMEFSGPKKGARLRLEEPFRAYRDPRAVPEGFVELPVGHEFDAESRLVVRKWGANGGRPHEPTDDERSAERAKRYAEQDILRETFGRLGLPEVIDAFGDGPHGFALADDDVKIGRAALVAWLAKTDPVAHVQRIVYALAEAGARSRDEWEENVDGQIAELRRQLAQTPDELAAATAPDPESF